jgi:TonB family protein
MTRTRFLLAVFLALFATGAFAQDWKGFLNKTDRDLRAGRYEDARRTSIKLINSMMDNLNHGNRAMYTLALTVAYRAVAEAGLQRYDEADWYWHVARSLYPSFDVTPYGEAGAWLKEHSDEKIDTVDAAPSEIQQPVCINRRDPKYPLGAVIGSVAEPIIVRVVIDADGTVRHPRLVNTTAAPTLLYAATEAVKKWQFQPAMVDGKPQPMDFELTVNFQMPEASQ